MVREGRLSANIKNIGPHPNDELFQSLTPGVIRWTAPQGTMCIGVHGTEVGYVVGYTVI